MSISKSSSMHWICALLLNLALIPASAWGQVEKGVEKRTLLVTTNVPHAKLIRLEDGAVLATANENGVIIWAPEGISKADCRLEIQAQYHVAQSISLRRKVRKSILILNGIASSIVGGSAFGLTIESADGQSLNENQVLVGAAIGVAGGLFGTVNPRNYCWKPSSKNLTVTLRHTPEYMDNLWQEIKSGESISRIERFRDDYPEFERKDEIEKELGRLMYQAILKDIAAIAEEALENPDEVKNYIGAIQSQIQALSNWEQRFGETQQGASQKDRLGMVMRLLEAAPKTTESEWALAMSTLEQDVALPCALAGFLFTCSQSESPRETLLQTLNWPKQVRYDLLKTSAATDAISSLVLQNWKTMISWDDNQLVTTALKSHLTSWRGTLAQLESGLSFSDRSVASYLEEQWARELSSWSRPEDLECVLSKQLMNAWIQVNEMEANAVLDAWRGLVLPRGATLVDVLKSCNLSSDLLPSGTFIPLHFLEVSGLFPPECKVHLEWSKGLGDVVTTSPDEVMLPSASDVNQTWSYLLKDGRKWKISTVSEERQDPLQPWSGTYSGVQPSYTMKNAQGEPIVIGGNKVVVSKVRYILRLNDFNASISQEGMDDSATKANYQGQCKLRTAKNSSTVLDCTCESTDGESTGNFVLDIDLANGKARFVEGFFGGPEFEVINSTPRAVEDVRRASCFWVYDTADKPQFLMVSGPHSSQVALDDIDFMVPISLTTSNKGMIYPALADSILKQIELLAKHPGLSNNQVSAGRSSRFDEVESEIATIESELDPLLPYLNAEILPSNVSWNILNQIPDKLSDLTAKWEEIDNKLKKQEVKKYVGTYEEVDYTYGYIYTIVIGADGRWASKFWIGGAEEYRSGNVVGGELYEDNGDYLGKVDGKKITRYLDGQVASVLYKQ